MKHKWNQCFVLIALAGASLLIFFAQHGLGWWSEVAVHEGIGVEQLWGVLNIDALRESHYWVLLTHLFIHANFLHVLINSAILGMAGYQLLRFVDYKQFVFIFAGAGLVGGLAQLYYQYFMGSDANLLGSSSGAAGVLFALVALRPNMEIFSMSRARANRASFQVRHLALGFIMVWLAWAIADVYHPPMSDEMVANAAHLGGALTGWQIGHILAGRNQKNALPALAREFAAFRPTFPQKVPRKKSSPPTGPVSLTGLSTKTKPVSLCITPADEEQALEMLEMDSYQEPLRPHLPVKIEDLLQTANELLDKILEQGVSSLTPKERSTLDYCSRALANKK